MIGARHNQRRARQVRRLARAVAAFLLLVAAGAFAADSKADDRDQPVGKPTTLKARFVRFDRGDYLHAVFAVDGGKERSFFIDGAGLPYFLALHRDEPVSVTYQVMVRYVPEAGERMRIETLVDARAGKTTCAEWWRRETATRTPAQLAERYGPLVEKLIPDP